MPRSRSNKTLEKAWATRFSRWKGYALSLTGNVTDAEEIVQEAVTRTMRARPRLETVQDAHNYVLTAVRTAAYQMFKRRQRNRPLDDCPRLDEVMGEVDADPLFLSLAREERAFERKLIGRALGAVQELTPVQQEVVELLVLRDPPMRLREVAAIQDAPISTVHSRLQAALRELGQHLRDESEPQRSSRRGRS